MSVVITCIELPGGPDTVIESRRTSIVHRALSDGAPFQYIVLGDGEPHVRVPPTAEARIVSGRYDVLHTRDEAAAPFGPDGSARPVTFINCMEVEPGREDVAFEFWKEVNAYMVTKPGYRWHRLHRRAEAGAPFGLVNVAGWESAEAWEAAHDEGFRALAVRPDLPFRPVPTLCEVVHDGDGGTGGDTDRDTASVAG
jgi:hypothetical protein